MYACGLCLHLLLCFSFCLQSSDKWLLSFILTPGIGSSYSDQFLCHSSIEESAFQIHSLIKVCLLERVPVDESEENLMDFFFFLMLFLDSTVVCVYSAVALARIARRKACSGEHTQSLATLRFFPMVPGSLLVGSKHDAKKEGIPYLIGLLRSINRTSYELTALSP